MEEIHASYFFMIIFSLKGHSCLKSIRCLTRFGIIFTTLKNVKNTHGGMSLLLKLQTYFAKSIYSSMGAFHASEIVQMVPNCAMHSLKINRK